MDKLEATKKSNLTFHPSSQNVSSNQNLNTSSRLINTDERVSYSLSLFWTEEQVQRGKLKGFVNYTKQQEKASASVMSDLKAKGHQFRIGTTHTIKLKRCAEVIGTQDQKQQQIWPNVNYCIEGAIFQRKINLPVGYTYIPNQFEGFIVKGLSIANQHGAITWITPVSIQGVDFSTGLSIDKDSIYCKHRQLLKDVVVQFFNLPAEVDAKLKYESKQKVVAKFKKQVEKQEHCRFIKYEQKNKHWWVHIMMATSLRTAPVQK